MINLLVSKPYMSDGVIDYWNSNRVDIRMIVDSGAFSNWKQGKETSVKEYVDFINNLPLKPWRYFTLDRIGDPKTTWTNYQQMLSSGLTPVPIFTRGTQPGELDRLYETSDLVGIGVGPGTNNHKGYLKYIVNQNKGRPLHWLGVTNPNMVSHFQPYSCDASSWESGGRYGSIQIYKGGGRFQAYRSKDRSKAPDPLIWRLIRSYGFDPKRLQYHDAWHGGESVSRRLGCASWVRYTMDVEKRFGTRIFLALTTPQAIKQCVEEYRKELKKSHEYI